MEDLELGIAKRLANWVLGQNKKPADQSDSSVIRRCHFEIMEPRRVMTADPVVVGVTYHEGDSGTDNSPDHFEVTFQGGSSTTKLTSFTINGDQDLSGTLSDGDMFFDHDANNPGAGGSFPFQFDAAASLGITASDIVSVQFGTDGLSMTVTLKNFEAGDKFAFGIDVDEVERSKIDKIASGIEFEGTYLSATFADAHYTFANKPVSIIDNGPNNQTQQQYSGRFFDHYDKLMATGGGIAKTPLSLRTDNDGSQEDRSAASIDVYELTPKPVVISGQVYHDENLNCERDASEKGISDVTINLLKRNSQTGSYEQVATTKTDVNGKYIFDTNLKLMPGEYRLVEVQPNGFLDVGASAGKVEGVVVGKVLDNASGQENIISDITIPLGGNVASNYDFKEVRPASIAGKVWHDRNDDGKIDAGEEGIANVLIQVTRVGAKDASIKDPFAGTSPIFVRTGADGSYKVDALPPGLYEVVEINNYPGEISPLLPFIDGKDTIGNVRGTNVGVGGSDRHTQIVLCADDHGVEYNFGELKPTSISGHVSVTTPDGICLDPNDPNFEGLQGVTLQLFDANGQLVGTTQTNANGFYEFTGLRNGTYTVVEVQPAGYLDGTEAPGKVNGATVGNNPTNDRLSNITLTSGQAGTNYDFCEHRPAEICGTVWHDLDNDGVMESGEQRIGGVLIELFDSAGNKISETRTDAEGKYCFKNLYAGTYCVKESQPTQFVDGKDSIGSVNGTQTGTKQDDKFCDITVKGGQKGENYNFGEIKHGSLSGNVFADADGNCVFDPSQGDKPLANVDLVLLDANGTEIARTKTNANGHYAFNNLTPGGYSVREITPNGYIDGGEFAGKVGGVTQGTVTDDSISGITLTSGANATNYDFCEHIPAEICGTVYHDRNNNGLQESGEEGIANTRVMLYDSQGRVVNETVTDAEGKYCFKNIIAGEYCVKESQPTNFTDGKDSSGKVNGANVGETKNDELCKITIRGGEKGTDYNFGEIRLAKLSGYVHTDNNGNCIFDANAGEKPIGDVTLELLDSSGHVLATTKSAADGSYAFDNLLPGSYSVRQVQPGNYYDVGQKVGVVDGSNPGTGTASANLISGIVISSGQTLTQYNFCETLPAEIHGRVWEDGPAFRTKDGLVPNDYRSQRDGIYQAGEDKVIPGVKMSLYYYNTEESLTPRPVTIADVLPGFYTNLGTNPNTRITTVTDANGEYHFRGLKAGNYIVVQDQPTGFTDSNEIVGSTTGLSFNSSISAEQAPQTIIGQFSQNQIMDMLANIHVNAGGISVQNNFTEVRAESIPDDRFWPGGDGTPRMSNPTPPSAPLAGYGGLAGSQPSNFTRLVGTTQNVQFQIGSENQSTAYTWHLSVVNAGQPRENREAEEAKPQWLQASSIQSGDWNRFEMAHGAWEFATTESDSLKKLDQTMRFGTLNGIPVAGDFDGDGIDEVAIYKDGYWMIDLNRNGKWDQEDLLAKLGDSEDTPVVGDWDGDGKDDLGIYGPIWQGDPEAIARDPGLPNPENRPHTRAKNVPPTELDGTNGHRTMKLTAYGRQRADAIDHIFGIDETRLSPVTGDWNGNGTRSIGTFEGGSWRLDINGDGEYDHNDVFCQFGAEGDFPVTGDFNGDGISQLAVYRAGTWIIDSNQNRMLDDADQRIQFGDAAGTPVVGDWNGDGSDDLSVYRSSVNVNGTHTQ